MKITGGGFIITGPDRSSIRAVQADVRRRIAFYASTRSYFPVLETHGFQEIGRQLHEMSLKGESATRCWTPSDRSSIRAVQADVRRRIAFYASTRSYFPVLETHGFQEIGRQLHEMSLKGEWVEMGELVSDEMLDAFCVSGEYDEIADKFVSRYGGLLDEVSFTVYTQDPPEEGQMRKIVQRLQQLG